MAGNELPELPLSKHLLIYGHTIKSYCIKVILKEQSNLQLEAMKRKGKLHLMTISTNFNVPAKRSNLAELLFGRTLQCKYVSRYTMKRLII